MGRRTPLIIITGRVIIIRQVITGGRPATFITIILIGITGTGGIIIGATIEIEKNFSKRDPIAITIGSFFPPVVPPVDSLIPLRLPWRKRIPQNTYVCTR
jgi:hypothetical protein